MYLSRREAYVPIVCTGGSHFSDSLTRTFNCKNVAFQLSRILFWSRQPPGCRAHQVELRQYPAQPQPLGMYVPSAFNFHCDTLYVTTYIPPIRFPVAVLPVPADKHQFCGLPASMYVRYDCAYDLREIIYIACRAASFSLLWASALKCPSILAAILI